MCSANAASCPAEGMSGELGASSTRWIAPEDNIGCLERRSDGCSEQVVRVGILDQHIEEVARLEGCRHVAQKHVAVDLRRIGLAAGGGADVAILIWLADFIDAHRQGAADIRGELGGAAP